MKLGRPAIYMNETSAEEVRTALESEGNLEGLEAGEGERFIDAEAVHSEGPSVIVDPDQDNPSNTEFTVHYHLVESGDGFEVFGWTELNEMPDALEMEGGYGASGFQVDSFRYPGETGFDLRDVGEIDARSLLVTQERSYRDGSVESYFVGDSVPGELESAYRAARSGGR